ncbi:MAG: hypothetical protein KGZ50_04615 [Peptococcaceae bacterium]|nr:hypothetical protein [Peptococcaceae bacterium]
MNGIELLRVISGFVTLIGERRDTDIKRYEYDGYAFGNYDIIFSVDRISVNLNSDRGHLSVLVGMGRHKLVDYFRLATGCLGEHYDCNSYPEQERLHQALERIFDSIDCVEEALSRKRSHTP